MISTIRARRVLVADDEPQMLDAYRRVLDGLARPAQSEASSLDALSAELFGDETPASAGKALIDEIVYCRQGIEAVRAVEEGMQHGQPFAIVFLDMRMPPGFDGLETARRIRAIDASINIVIVTGFSDHKPAEIAHSVGRPEKLFYLLKPFDADELQQLTTALANRWSADIGLAEELATRVAELEAVNARLRESEARAQEAARTDALTGLANRTGLSERFQAEANAVVVADKQLSVLCLDLDRFKDVNDSLGHLAGDEVIREFARRVTETTGKEGFAARLGGDEFAVITTADLSRVAALGDRLLAACAVPYRIGDQVLQISASIGMAHSGPGRPDLLETMRRADIALYAAKASGRAVMRQFDPGMERDLAGAQRLARDLAQAIADDQLALHYQPLVSAEGARISAVEALLRWRHPSQGYIAPPVFIAVAEKSDLIHTLGDWVIRRAMSDARQWPDLVTAINISPVQFRAAGFVDGLMARAQETGIDPAKIELEITETVLIADMADAAEKLCRLKRLGFRIALDDFGSGYAGLGYLKQIPFDKLKIDRSFVQDLRNKPGAESVIRSIVDLARSFGLSITAEGVEDSAQHAFLKGAGCSSMQGFLFHKPMRAEDIVKLQGDQPVAKRSA